MARLGPWGPDIYDGDPWHARPFMRQETDDLPFDRDSIVLYSSYTEAIFWEESETPDYVTNAKSVLETKVLNPTNTDYGDEAVVNEKDVTEDSKAIWLGVFPTAKLHALWKQEGERSKKIDHGAVLELHIPTKPLQCLVDVMPGFKETGKLIKNSEDYIEKIGSGSRERAVQNLRERLRRVAKVDSNFKDRALNEDFSGHFREAELIQFASPYQAHLENVKRVWTPSFTKGHSWIPIEKYLENIKSQATSAPTFSIEKELGEQYNQHEKLRNAAENLRKAVLREYVEGTSKTAPQELFFSAGKLTLFGTPHWNGQQKDPFEWSEDPRKKLSSLSSKELESRIKKRIEKNPSGNEYITREEYVENFLKQYVHAQNQITEVLEEMASEFSFFQKLKGVHDFSFGPKIRTCYEVVEHRQKIERGSKAFYNAVLKVDEREKRKLKMRDWDGAEEVREFEIEANRGILNVVSEIPDLRPLESNLQKDPEEWLYIELESIRGELSSKDANGLIGGILGR